MIKRGPGSEVHMPSPSGVEEGIAGIAISKVADLARGFILKARPIVILHNLEKDHTVTIKLKRGLIRHDLVADDGSKQVVIKSSASAILLLTTALNESRKYFGKGYIEV